MIRDTIIDHVVVPAAIDDASAYLIVGTIAGIMFIAYHITNGVDRRLKERRR